MPRKKATPAKTTARSRTTRSAQKSAQDGIPQIYREMLAEDAYSTPTQPSGSGRPPKRRRISEEPIQPLSLDSETSPQPGPDVRREPPGPPEETSKHPQIIYDDFSNSSAESDIDFEDVELGLENHTNNTRDEHSAQTPLKLDLSTPTKASNRDSAVRRKPVTKAERDLRLDVHKWHLICLLLHLQCRNHWCESSETQSLLKPLIPRKIISMLHGKADQPQYQQLHSFNKAIEEISSLWTREWTTTITGLRRAYWREDLDMEKEIDETEDPVNFDDFKSAAATRAGSRDLGAQLFCALLRSVAVETRLVCSLQPLPFSAVARGKAPEKAGPSYTYGHSMPTSSTSTGDPSTPRWRLSEHVHAPTPSSRTPSIPKTRIKDSPYPIFWVEVLSSANGTWIPLDPVVRHTINKPKTGFEPPLSDPLNAMSYVIAFNEDGSAKDVTRRYTQHYNSKTRKLRIESTLDGEKWWKRTMKYFQRFKHNHEDAREQIEDAELTRREAAEEMPRKVIDFKGHPWFVLERHLKRNEVISPQREVGKVSIGTGKLEVVHRRSDVHIVRSADQWFRRGREVKAGEQPLRRMITSKNKGRADIEDTDENPDGTALYAESQTEVYVPPSVMNGRIPRNAYGNLDIYVPSMIPAHAIHIQHPLAMKAAKILAADAVEAVTGFDFKGRQGTAIVNGVVVAVEYREAIVEVIETLEYEQIQMLDEKRRAIALQKWKRLIAGLRIRERVEREYAGDEKMQDEGNSDDDEDDGTYEEESHEDQGGGFMPEPDGRPVNDSNDDDAAMEALSLPLTHEQAQPQAIIIVESPHSITHITRTEDGYEGVSPNGKEDSNLFGDEPEGGGFIRDATTHPENPIKIEDERHGGGFIWDNTEGMSQPGVKIEDDGDEQGGGFLSEDDVEKEIVPPITHTQTSLNGTTDGEGTNSVNNEDVLYDNDVGMEKVDEAPQHTHTDEDRDSLMDDNASLLSHDPDDSDAEPEWLVDLKDAD